MLAYIFRKNSFLMRNKYDSWEEKNCNLSLIFISTLAFAVKKQYCPKKIFKFYCIICIWSSIPLNDVFIITLTIYEKPSEILSLQALLVEKWSSVSCTLFSPLCFWCACDVMKGFLWFSNLERIQFSHDFTKKKNWLARP